MIAPAAHTSKGLAKAFVSSAGGKGPEILPYGLRPLFSFADSRVGTGPPREICGTPRDTRIEKPE